MTRNFALILPLLCSSDAFQIAPSRRGASLLQSQAEEHLEELAAEWETLENRVKEFANSPKVDESQAKELTTAFLKTAIDHAHTAEEVEEEHAIQAHHEFEQALQVEDTVRMILPLIHDDAAQWMTGHRVPFRLAEDGSLLKRPFYKYLGEGDPVGGDFDHRSSLQKAKDDHKAVLQELHEKEILAREEEGEAHRTLEELKQNEELLKETLSEFEVLSEQRKEKMEDLKKVKERRNRKKLLDELA